MLQDENLFNYIYSILNNPNENVDTNPSKIQAAKDYEVKKDYEKECNN